MSKKKCFHSLFINMRKILRLIFVSFRSCLPLSVIDFHSIHARRIPKFDSKTDNLTDPYLKLISSATGVTCKHAITKHVFYLSKSWKNPLLIISWQSRDVRNYIDIWIYWFSLFNFKIVYNRKAVLFEHVRQNTLHG